jgi:hypothetical protein
MKVMNIEDWVKSLSDQQCRALASQSGILGWLNLPILVVREFLSVNERAATIYKENYGKEASIPE